MFTLLNPGDEVLLPNPSWPNYQMQATLARAAPVFYSLAPERAFLPDLQEMESKLSPRTKLLLINSPSNPTGQVFSRKIMADLMAFARVNNLAVLSDEIYSEMVFSGETAPSALGM